MSITNLSLSSSAPGEDGMPILLIDTNPEIPFSAETTEVVMVDLSSLPAPKLIDFFGEDNNALGSVMVENYDPNKGSSIAKPFLIELKDLGNSRL
jgi:hypothetical protein